MSAATLIKKPLLAAKVEDVAKVSYPTLATPKIDGIRAMKIDSNLVSRTLKPIGNSTMRAVLESLLPDNSDGEIVVEGTFQDVQHSVMTRVDSANFSGRFTYYWFDYVKDDTTKPYCERVVDMREYAQSHPEMFSHPQATIVPLYPTSLHTVEDVVAYQAKALADKFEGVMLRKPSGAYKMGRATFRDGVLLKLKQFLDAEARVVGVQELKKNTNEKQTSLTGASQRSSKKDGLVPQNKLGSLLVVNAAGQEFSIGSGFNDEQRRTLWARKEDLIGKRVTYRYFEVGVKDAPRFPTFLGFRHEDDMSW